MTTFIGLLLVFITIYLTIVTFALILISAIHAKKAELIEFLGKDFKTHKVAAVMSITISFLWTLVFYWYN